MARGRGKLRDGTVVSDKMDQTVVVAVHWQQHHPLYRKSIRRVSKFYAHDEQKISKQGDLVRIRETRPLSRTKRWKVVAVLERHEIPEVKPADLDQAVSPEVAVEAIQQQTSEDMKE